MPSPYYTHKDVRDLAERLDGYFLGYYFDFLMEPGKRSGLDKGKGTRSQTFRRRFLCYMLRVTFECEESLVEKALRKDRSSIREGVDEFKSMLVYNTWGLGIERFCERAYETEQDYLQIYTRSDEAPDPEFIGWRRSLAAWAFFCATQAWRMEDPSLAKEYLSAAEVRELEDAENVILLEKRPLKSYKTIQADNSKKYALSLEKSQKIVIRQPDKPPAPSSICISHPAIALIERNRHMFKDLSPMVCSDRAMPDDCFTLIHAEPDLLKGKGERIRIKTKAEPDTLKSALPRMVNILTTAGYKASVQLNAEPCARPRGSYYALVRI